MPDFRSARASWQLFSGVLCLGAAAALAAGAEAISRRLWKQEAEPVFIKQTGSHGITMSGRFDGVAERAVNRLGGEQH
ncbi:MAG: hypothetical protein AB1461_14535 [Thermodesulfobacteriota bacterium]